MSINLSIKSVPDEWAQALRQRAERNHRSLQGELMAMVERAVQEASPLPTPGLVGERQGTLSVEELGRRAAERFANMPAGLPTGTEIIREMRDTRWG